VARIQRVTFGSVTWTVVDEGSLLIRPDAVEHPERRGAWRLAPAPLWARAAGSPRTTEAFRVTDA
jgi:hypothetical protein